MWFFIKKCMTLQLHQVGVLAKVSCLSKFLHPSEHIRNKYSNPVSGHHLEGCVIVWQEVKRVSKRDQLCVIVKHDDFKANKEFIKLHAVKRYFHVTEEGDPDQFFDDPGTGHAGEEAPAQVPSQQLLTTPSTENLKMQTPLKLFVELLTLMMTMNQLPKMFQGQQTVLIRCCCHNGVTVRLNFPVNPTTNGYYVWLFEPNSCY